MKLIVCLKFSHLRVKCERYTPKSGLKLSFEELLENMDEISGYSIKSSRTKYTCNWSAKRCQDYMRLRLARSCVHLRWLAKTCANFDRDQICKQFKAVFHRLATQPKSTQVEWRPLTYYHPMRKRIVCLTMRLACTCEETFESVWPPNASLYASSTCVHLRQLDGPFGHS